MNKKIGWLGVGIIICAAAALVAGFGLSTEKAIPGHGDDEVALFI